MLMVTQALAPSSINAANGIFEQNFKIILHGQAASGDGGVNALQPPPDR